MKSMVKRDVAIAFTPHIDMITQMVIDAYEVLAYRRKDKGQELRCDDCLYHRFLRQTGHSAAMKILLSETWQDAHGIKTYGLFHKQAEALALANKTDPRITNVASIGSNPEVVYSKIPSDTTVLIVSDSLHDGERIERAWRFIDQHLRSRLPNLTLVVFLG